MKKVLISIIFLVGLVPAAVACELCEEQQPKWLQGAVHGAGPQGPADYIIMYAGIAIVIAVLFFSVKLLIKPGEKNPDHVKYSILNPNKEAYGEG